MALHEIAKTGSLSDSGEITFSPPSGKIWKLYGEWYDCNVTINGSDYTSGQPDFAEFSDQVTQETKGIYLDEDDTFHVSGQTSGTLSGRANMYAQEVGNDQTTVPVETQWFNGTLGSLSRTSVTIPTGSWKLFSRQSNDIFYQLPADDGNESWVTIGDTVSNKTPYLTGGTDLYIYNHNSDRDQSYNIGLLRIE